MQFEELMQLAGQNVWPILLYLLAINIAAFVFFALDKWKSQNGMWRIPEKQLLLLALLGGAPAMVFGQKILRHKTRKQPFAFILSWLFIVEIVLFLIGLLYFPFS
ncbi:MAG: DUF1294 domain-containing protein [Salaquimonas sp.]